MSAALAPLLSSKRMDYGTPRSLYAKLDRVFHFELDAATSPDNPLGTPRFYAPPENALELPWARSTFLNPPYGRELPLWVTKAFHEALMGNTVVCLLPARPDTRWWKICEHNEITLVSGRIHFEVPEHTVPEHYDLEILPERAAEVCEGDGDDKLIEMGIARRVHVPERLVPRQAGEAAPFPSAIVVMRPRLERRISARDLELTDAR